MHKVKNLILIILVTIAGLLIVVPILIISIPIFIVYIPLEYFRRKKFKKEYNLFLQKQNGKNFFVYNNRQNSKLYLKEHIIPKLDNRIEIIYLNGRKIESEYNSQYISESLLKLSHYKRFPHLMKIREGTMIDKSINNHYYNVMNSNKPKAEFFNSINHFFDLESNKKSQFP